MYREPTVTRRKPGLKSIVWTRRKKETFDQNRTKKQELEKMRRGLGTSGTTLSIPPWDLEGEEEEQDIENLFEQIMKENFPNLVKEVEF